MTPPGKIPAGELPTQRTAGYYIPMLSPISSNTCLRQDHQNDYDWSNRALFSRLPFQRVSFMIHFNAAESPSGERLGKEPLVVAHDCQEHSICSNHGLHELLTSVPGNSLKAKMPSQKRNERFDTEPISREQALKILDNTNDDIWIVLHQIENTPRLKPIFQEMASFLRSDLPPHYGKANLCTGSMLISRGAASTPYHLDYGSNLLLQLRGKKRFYVFSPNDPELVPRQALQEFFNGNATPPSLKYQASFAPKALQLDLEPGKGVYMPSTSPHCTDTQGSDLSVTLSLSFASPLAEHLRRATLFDARAPYLWFVPDGLKVALLWGYETFLELRGNGQPQHKSFKPFAF